MDRMPRRRTVRAGRRIGDELDGAVAPADIGTLETENGGRSKASKPQDEVTADWLSLHKRRAQETRQLV